MLRTSSAFALLVTAAGSTAIAGTALAADNCQSVVADTVAEISAGAGPEWSEAAEALVRRAAGAACVKAQSGRYPDTLETLTEAPVAAGTESVTEASEAEAAEPAEKDDGSFEAGGITFRPLSGSPSQKSYERSRVDD